MYPAFESAVFAAASSQPGPEYTGMGPVKESTDPKGFIGFFSFFLTKSGRCRSIKW